MNGRIKLLVGSVAVAGLLGVATMGTALAADPTPGPRGPMGAAAGAVGAVCQGAGYGFAGVAQALQKLAGLQPEEIVAERQAGKSAVQIAGEKGVAEDALVNEVLAARKAGLDEAVQAGRIDQERADFMLKNMSERVKDGLNRTDVGPRGGGFGPARADGAQRGAGQPGRGLGPGGMARWAGQGQAQ